MSDTEKIEEVPQGETKLEEKAAEESVENTETSGNKTDDEWELLEPEDENQESKEVKNEEKTFVVVDESEKIENMEDKREKKQEEAIEIIEDVVSDSPSDQSQNEPMEDDTRKKMNEQAKEPDTEQEQTTVENNDNKNTDVSMKPLIDVEPTEDIEKSEESECVKEATQDVEEKEKDSDEQKDKEKEEAKVEMAPTEDPALPNLEDVHLLQSELLMERVKLRKRAGGAAGRRPPTKRASWTDGQGRPISWMFADSAEPKLVDQELPSDDDDEKEAENKKEDEVQTTPIKSRVPIGGVPSPMMLPGLADAVKFRKKAPARHARELGHKTHENTEVKSPPWSKNVLKSPPNDGGLKVSGLSPSWASGSAFKQSKPAKDTPEKRPKPVVRPRPKPRPKSIAVTSELQGQPVVLSQELLQKVERQSIKQKDAEIKSKDTEIKDVEKNSTVSKKTVTVNGMENKPKQNSTPTVNNLIRPPSVSDEKPETPSPVLEKKLNSDIINAQKKMEDKIEKEDITKTPQWMDQKKKLPPIPKNKPKPAPRPAKPDRPIAPSQPQWKQDLMKKKKEDEAQGKKKPVVVPQKKTNLNAPVITTLPDWQQDLAEKVQKKKKEKSASEKGHEEKSEKEKIPEWKRQAAERAQRRKKMENVTPPSNSPSHVNDLPHPDETPEWKKQLQEKKNEAPIDKEIIVINAVETQSNTENEVENNKEQSGNIPQWKKELMERKQRSRSLGDVEQANRKMHISEIIPKDSSAVPSWKAELEKRKQARLEKTYKSVEQVEETF